MKKQPSKPAPTPASPAPPDRKYLGQRWLICEDNRYWSAHYVIVEAYGGDMLMLCHVWSEPKGILYSPVLPEKLPVWKKRRKNQPLPRSA